MTQITTTFLLLTQVQWGDFVLDDVDEQKVISLLTEVIEKIKRENQQLNIKQAHIQVTWKSVYCVQYKCKINANVMIRKRNELQVKTEATLCFIFLLAFCFTEL